MAKKNATAKRSVQRCTLNQPVEKLPNVPITGTGFNEQDAKRRMGDFESAGEHSRKGGRTSGIVGQKKQQLHTDKANK